jgi:hypothetical protein
MMDGKSGLPDNPKKYRMDWIRTSFPLARLLSIVRYRSDDGEEKLPNIPELIPRCFPLNLKIIPDQVIFLLF